MKKTIWEKRIPTLLGLFCIGISTLLIAYIIRFPQLLQTGATPAVAVEDMRITNQTANALTISFKTGEPLSAQIRFGSSPSSSQLVFDDRDEIEKEVGKYQTHYFTVNNLSPGQEYFFSILLAAATIDNNGAFFRAKTANQITLEEGKSIPPLTGIVQTEKGTDVEDALVFVTIEGASAKSSLIKSQGRFFIPLTTIYTADLTGQYTWREDEVVTVEVIPGDTIQPGIIVKVPYGAGFDLGTITLGTNVDLTKEATAPPLTSAFGEAAFPPIDSGNGQPSIATPGQGAFVLDPIPLIRGSGEPLQRVQVTVQSDPQTGTAVVSENGQWSYQPEKPLLPGKHSVTVKFFQGNKVVETLTSEFEVLASGLSVADSATPSSSPPSPTAIITVTTTPEPTVQPLPNTATVFPVVILTSVGGLLLLFGAVLLGL